MKYIILFILLLINNNSILLGQCNIYVENTEHLSYKQHDHPLINRNQKPLETDDCNKSLHNNFETDSLQHQHKNYDLPLHPAGESQNAQTKPIHIVYGQSVPITTVRTVQGTLEYIPKNPNNNSMPDYNDLHQKPITSHYTERQRSHGAPPTILEPPNQTHNQLPYNKRPLTERPFERLELLPSTILVNDSKPAFDFEDKAYNTTENSARFQNENNDDSDESRIFTESPTPLDEARTEKEDYSDNGNVQLSTTQTSIPQRPVRTKTIQIAQPALKARTFEVHLPAIQKEFYDIEERFIIKPAGAVVVELDNPVAKIAKSETILPLGHPHPAVANAYQQNGKSNAFSNIIYSSTGSLNRPQGSYERHTLPITTVNNKNRKNFDAEANADANDQGGATSKKADLRVNPLENLSNNSNSFGVEYLDGTFTTNTQHNQNNFKQFGQYREAISPRTRNYPSTSRPHQHDFDDYNKGKIIDESSRVYAPSTAATSNIEQYYSRNHHVPSEKSNEFIAPHYSKPYGNIRLHTNNAFDMISENPSNVNDSLHDNKSHHHILNTTFNSSHNLNNDKSHPNHFTKHESDFKSNIPLQNIIIYANLNEILNHTQHEYTEKEDGYGTLHNINALPLKNVIIYANANKSSDHGPHQYNEHIADNKNTPTNYNNRQANIKIAYPYQMSRIQHSDGNGQKFMRLIERPQNSRNNFGRLANYANEFNGDTDTEKIDTITTFLSDIDAVPGSRIIASTPASKDPSLINESVQTRRIVINHPFHTVREIVEHEPYTNYHEIEIEEPDIPEIFKAAHYILSNNTQSN